MFRVALQGSIVALLGYSSRIGLGVAIALAQIGEFSFLLAALSWKALYVLSESAGSGIAKRLVLQLLCKDEQGHHEAPKH